MSGAAEWAVALAPLVVGTTIFMLLIDRLPREEKQFLVAALALQFLGAAAVVIVTREVYGYGDMLKYHRYGIMLADHMSRSSAYIGDVVRLALQQDSYFSYLEGAGRSTGSMHALSGLLAFLLFDSLPAMCIAVAACGAIAKLGLYHVFRLRVPPQHRWMVAVAMMMVPSFVFWTSGVTKEGFAVVGLSALLWAVAPYIRLCDGPRSLLRLAVAPPAFLLVGLTKPYLLFPAALAAAAAWYVGVRQRASGFGSPLRFLLAVGASILVMSLLSSLFPRYAADTVVDQAASLREVGAAHKGGSSFDAIGPADEGVASHLAYAPLAVLTVLFRPVLFEVRNALMAVSALEMTVFLVLFARGIRRRGVRQTVLFVSRDPVLAFCAVFVLVFAIAVGLSTTNLGTLARYRSPMLPFFVLILLLLSLVGPRVGAPSVVTRPRVRTRR